MNDFPGRFQPSSLECNKKQANKQIKQNKRKYNQKLWKNEKRIWGSISCRFKESFPSGVPAAKELCKKHPYQICWKMECCSKNTWKGTETFQRRQGSGVRNKKRKIKLQLQKKEEWKLNIFTKEAQKLPPLPDYSIKKGEKNSQWETVLRKISPCTITVENSSNLNWRVR